MIRVDDEEEQNEKLKLQSLQIAASASGVKARLTRTSTRGVVNVGSRQEYGRYVILEENELEMARKTALIWKEEV